MKKNLFCAHCQADTEQDFRVSASGVELISRCGCGRELKFPASLSASELRAAFDAHKAANHGQVPVSESPADPADHPAMKALAEL